MGVLVFAQTQVFGVHLLGFDAVTGRKLLFTVVVFALVALVSAIVGRVFERVHGHPRVSFWGRQIVRILTAVVVVSAILSIWFDDPARLTTVIGLLTAGVAIALQKVITSFAGYVIILRGKQFEIGDRITIGRVRGDVVALDFMQTTVLEMGQAPGEQDDDPSIWIEGRQYTGRLVRVTNDKIFDSPLYNYTREFPYIWEEIKTPVKYGADHARAEQILLDVVRSRTIEIQRAAGPALDALRRRYIIPGPMDVEPRVFMKLTDNWIELAVRFIAPAHGVRELKSAMSREILARFDAATLEIASSTFGIVEVPPIAVKIKSES
ncbi:MAG TPA: mechanosensitive ion channel domain-containing protein [Gemmatimonadaceae bacterium]|nr:mechanosensitive ion channel domain-containing protein [Gemmatimonadaceae bacterium]